jgi:hypothetical protein
MSEPIPLLRATVGAPVVSQDGEKVGKVKEIRQGAFKVETGLFKPDYWLSGDAIESAVPDEAVTLNIPRDQIDTCKIDAPSQAA